MKKTYFRPEIEISVFKTEDIITTSGASISNGGELTDSAFDVTYDELFGNENG